MKEGEDKLWEDDGVCVGSGEQMVGTRMCLCLGNLSGRKRLLCHHLIT